MSLRILTFALTACLLAPTAPAQFFNIDMDSAYSPPAQGGGAPSSAFGAAAGQPGYWHAVELTAYWPVDLIDVAGVQTSVVMTVASSDSMSGQAAGNPLTSGDYALLMNDARQVGYTDPGGFQTYTFTGLANGLYQVYTYAAPPYGGVSATPVEVFGSTSPNPQVVTGPITGDTFALGITHSLHEVQVTDGTLVIDITVPPGVEGGAWIAGIQIAPEPTALMLLALGGLLIAQRRR